MIWCKCIQKIRDNNGIIIEYEIADLNGEHRIVSKDALKNAIAAGQVSMVNLKLSKDGKLMDRAIDEQAKLMKQLHLGEVTEADKNKYMKARMLGIAPTVVENGCAKGFPNSEQIAITPNISSINNTSELRNKTLIFYGNNKVTFFGIGFYKKAIVRNPTIVTSVVNNDFRADEVIFDFDDMDLKLIDIIFKYLKSDDECYRKSYNLMLVEASRMDCKDVYNKVASILKRQKPSSKYGRRCYDIIVYIRLIYCMYLSFGDKSILELANDYIEEYNAKHIYADNHSDWHDRYVSSNNNLTHELIDSIRSS